MWNWLMAIARRKSAKNQAYELGVECATDFLTSLRSFMESRFAPVHRRFLDILAQNFVDDIQRQDAPPLTSARINYDCFLQNVQDIRSQMHVEITEYIQDWIRLGNDAEFQTNVKRACEMEVENFCTNLSLHGLKLFSDYAVPLKHADDAWRKANPSLALTFPEEGDLSN